MAGFSNPAAIGEIVLVGLGPIEAHAEAANVLGALPIRAGRTPIGNPIRRYANAGRIAFIEQPYLLAVPPAVNTKVMQCSAGVSSVGFDVTARGIPRAWGLIASDQPFQFVARRLCGGSPVRIR